MVLSTAWKAAKGLLLPDDVTTKKDVVRMFQDRARKRQIRKLENPLSVKVADAVDDVTSKVRNAARELKTIAKLQDAVKAALEGPSEGIGTTSKRISKFFEIVSEKRGD